MSNPRKLLNRANSPQLKTKQIPYYLLKPVFFFAQKKDAVRALKVIREALAKEFGGPVFEGDPKECAL